MSVRAMLTRSRLLFAFAFVALVALAVARGVTLWRVEASVTTPAAAFGASIGDDYFLANYSQLEAYWRTLDRESDRMTLVDIGRTEEGRHQWMAVVSSPGNLARLEHYKQVSRRLSLAEGVSEAEASWLARDGKVVVWIDGGLHADEVLGSQQLIELVYQLVSRSDPETLRVLDDTIVLAVPANPDGHEAVANWYMRERLKARRSLDGLPRPYQKYVGHDNNRDFYMSAQAETINMNRVLYREWFPQIVYDHHQSGPAGTVMFAPPFRGPSNHVIDPLIPEGIDLVGTAMHARFAAEGKGGVTMRGGGDYSMWWNGGLRTTAYFHNQIGLLTETIGSPTPLEIPSVPERQRPSADLPLPIAPQTWPFRRSIDYSMTANRAVLDVASRHRESFLLNAYRMATASIRRGSEDSWTPRPTVPRVAATRDPRGYILRADQPDFPTATKFVDALLKAGVTVHRATADFTVGDVRYPAGSYVVKTAQAFRPHVLDMFEPQDHPGDDMPNPVASLTPPYDGAGWTLAFQMGVKFDRILDPFDGPFAAISAVTPVPRAVTGPAQPAGYLLSHHQNDAFIAVNRLLAAGQTVRWPADRSVGAYPAGTGAMYVEATTAARSILLKAASDLGVSVTGIATPPAGPALRLRTVRVGLWDKYGGSSPSGWVRWLLERYEFPFEVAYVQALDAGDIGGRFDVIVLTDDASILADGVQADIAPADLPAQYRAMTGGITSSRTLPRLKAFVEEGGTLVTIGRSTRIAMALGAPLRNALVETQPDGTSWPLGADAFFLPGSVVRVRVDNTMPLGYGFERDADVYFDNSPVFAATRTHMPGRPTRVAWYDSPRPLRSGWAVGQAHLSGGLAAVDVRLGEGRIVLFGPEITFRGQSHGTFKFLFNAMLLGRAVPER